MRVCDRTGEKKMKKDAGVGNEEISSDELSATEKEDEQEKIGAQTAKVSNSLDWAKTDKTRKQKKRRRSGIRGMQRRGPKRILRRLRTLSRKTRLGKQQVSLRPRRRRKSMTQKILQRQSRMEQ
jgi:hypothetical protein